MTLGTYCLNLYGYISARVLIMIHCFPNSGSMREIDVIDVSRQEDYKMLMREWTEYFSSPNRQKIFNVISLEFSKTRLVSFLFEITKGLIRKKSK